MNTGANSLPLELNTPVVFILFNRPDTTAKVFAEIRKARPKKLLVIADGPREGRAGEKEACDAARKVVSDGVDWPCELLTNYSDTNLGCKRRVVSGLDWAFEQVPEAIILEDDCIPHPTFFSFCQEMLAKFRHDTRVFQISGTNFLTGKYEVPYSYYFTGAGLLWGWATWRRAWKHYDASMKLWPEVAKANTLTDMMAPAPKELVRGQALRFQEVYQNTLDTWCYQWDFALLMQSGLVAVSKANLIVNIGFDERATHTTKENLNAPKQLEPATFPLLDPPYMVEDPISYRLYLALWREPFGIGKIVRKAKRILGI